MAAEIPKIELGSGLEISRVLTGLWQIADLERSGKVLDPAALTPKMKAYQEAGFTTFDMADHYGSAEVIAGYFRQELEDPSSVQLLTKWVPEPGPSSPEKVRKAVQRSLQRLQVETIDLLQYHAWNYGDPAWLDDLFELQRLQEEGLIQHLGLTNFDAAHLNMVVQSGIKVVANQVCYSLIDQRAAGAMTDVCMKHNIKLLAFGTLAGGFLSERWLGKPDIRANQQETWSQMKYKRFIDVAGGWERFQDLLEVLRQIAQEKNVSIANLASRYILDQPAVGGVIIGARLGKSEHISSNRQLFDFELDPNSSRAIQNALTAFSPIPGGCGDEYRKPPFLTASGDLSHHLKIFPPPYDLSSDSAGRAKIFSGTTWEAMAGYCRAIKTGNRILVSGTTATHQDKVIGGNDAAAQTHFVVDKIAGVIQSFGGSLKDIVRTRIFIQRMEDWEAVARVHGQRFKEIQPANTLVRADLIGNEYLVEIEAEAVI